MRWLGSQSAHYIRRSWESWVSPEVSGKLSCCLQIPNGWVKRGWGQIFLRVALWKDKRKQTQVAMSQYKKRVFFIARGIKHKEVAEGFCRISTLGDIRNLTGQGNILKLDLLWTEGCTRWPLESSSNLHGSMILKSLKRFLLHNPSTKCIYILLFFTISFSSISPL